MLPRTGRTDFLLLCTGAEAGAAPFPPPFPTVMALFVAPLPLPLVLVVVLLDLAPNIERNQPPEALLLVLPASAANRVVSSYTKD